MTNFQSLPDADKVLNTLRGARDKAMKHTVKARIPECGVFGEIAQDLAWAIDQIQGESEVYRHEKG